MRAAILALLLALPAAAQTTTLAVGLEAGNLRPLGYVAPLWGVWGSVEHETERFSVNLVADWSPARKYTERLVVPLIAPHYSVTAQPQALLKLGPVLLGGGWNYTYTRDPEYSKYAIRWHLAAGVEFPLDRTKTRILYTHIEPGTDRENRLTSDGVTVRFDAPLSGKLRWRAAWNVQRSLFDETDRPDLPRRTGWSYMFRIGVLR